MKNDKIVRQLLTHNYLKGFKDNENIPKYSFKFMSTDMLSTRINVDTHLSGKTLLTSTISTLSLILRLFNNNSYLCFIDFIGVTTHIRSIKETRTNFEFIKNRDIWLLIE
jgi:hypothetical protein